MKISRQQLRRLIKEALMQESFISGPRGTMHVPDHDPYDDLDHRIKKNFSRENIVDDEGLRNQVASLDSALKDTDITKSGDELKNAMHAYSDPAGAYDYQSLRAMMQKAISQGHGEGPATPRVAKIISDCVVIGSASDNYNVVSYAAEALRNAGFSVGDAAFGAKESDYDIIESYDEASDTGMLYFPMHPNFEYSM